MIYLLPVLVVLYLLVRIVRWSVVMILRISLKLIRRILRLSWCLICWLWHNAINRYREYRMRSAPWLVQMALGTTGKLRCVPCCGIYPEVGQPVRRGSFSPLRMAPHLPSRLPTVFPTPVRTLLPSHMGTLLQTLFPTPLGTPLQALISQLYSSLSPALSPKCPKFRTPFPPPLPSLSRHLYSHISTLWYTMPKMANTGRACGVIMEETERLIVKYCLIRRCSRNNC